MIDFYSKKAYKSQKNTILQTVSISDFIQEKDKNLFCADNANIHLGGWQSWNPGFELLQNEKQPAIHCKIFKQWNRYIEFPGTVNHPSKNKILSQFFTYLRWDDFYLVFVSCGNIKNLLPPVQFIIKRNENTISFELSDIDKQWSEGELQAQIEIFTANGYFEVKDKLQTLFGSSNKSSKYYTERFSQINFLGEKIYGWESWYNHYEKINEKLILNDLKALKNTENIITLCDNYKTNTKNIIFQIDDGWEKQLGTWEINKKTFPKGLKTITEQIEEEGFIPGLWIAPFIVDLRSKSANEHPEYLLRDKNGHLVKAGFNPRWGANGTFYCLDLSRDDVLKYLDSLFNTIIEEWGFRYIKLDFLYAGMHVGNHQNGDAAYKWFDNALKIITKRKFNSENKQISYLGCGMPFELSFNLLPLSRIGCDTYEHWKNKLLRLLNWNGRNEAYLNIKDTLGHALWDKTIFANDPDVIFIRKDNCSLSTDEKILIATVDALFGSQIMYSDDPTNCTSQEELELSAEITKIIKELKNEDFSVKLISKDYYEIKSRSNLYTGSINLGKEHKLIINKV